MAKEQNYIKFLDERAHCWHKTGNHCGVKCEIQSMQTPLSKG